ncbi:V-type ATP synthase subunit D [Nocardioides dilutus]
MSRLRGQPPGRAGLMWLQRRLGLAHRAASRLDQKLRVLRTEQAAFALLLQRTGPAWEHACGEAETWLLRAALLGGQEGVRPPAGLPAAEVRIAWTTALGTTYPAHGTCLVPDPDPHLASVSSAALVEAAAAHRRALEAAVQHAVASTAARAIDAEVLATRQRLRGVQDRWVPRLETALAELRLALDEAEHAEGIRLRWAVDREGVPR